MLTNIHCLATTLKLLPLHCAVLLFLGDVKAGGVHNAWQVFFLSVQRNPFATGTRMADSLGPVGSRVTCPWIRLGLCMQSLNF